MSVDYFLDHFPLNEQEICLLLKQQEKNSFDENDKGSMEASSLARFLLKTLLPEFRRFVKVGMESVFVLCSALDDDDENNNKKKDNEATSARYLETCATLMGRRNDRLLMQIFHSVAISSAGESPLPNVISSQSQALMNLVYRFAKAGWILQQHSKTEAAAHYCSSGDDSAVPPQSWCRALENHVNSKNRKNTIAALDWWDWVQTSAPHLPRLVSTVCHRLLVLFGTDDNDDDDEAAPIFRTAPFAPAVLDSESDILVPSSVMNDDKGGSSNVCDTTLLSCLTLGGNWRLLITSARDGLSLGMIQQGLMSYAGPTVLLIQTTNGDRFGYYTETPWKSSTKWIAPTEGADAFLFGLDPEWKMLSRTGDNTHLQYLYQPMQGSIRATQKNHLVGVAVGGVAADAPRLHLSENLDHCRMTSVMDLSFAEGSLLRNNESPFFAVERAEVWAVAVGISESEFQTNLARGMARAEIRDIVRNRASAVDKRAFLDHFFANGGLDHDGHHGLFAHREQARGRADFAVNDSGDYYVVQGKEPSSGAAESNQP